MALRYALYEILSRDFEHLPICGSDVDLQPADVFSARCLLPAQPSPPIAINCLAVSLAVHTPSRNHGDGTDK